MPRPLFVPKALSRDIPAERALLLFERRNPNALALFEQHHPDPDEQIRFLAAIYRKVDRKGYSDPPDPDEPLESATFQARLEERVNRARTKRAIRHPADRWLPGLTEHFELELVEELVEDGSEPEVRQIVRMVKRVGCTPTESKYEQEQRMAERLPLHQQVLAMLARQRRPLAERLADIGWVWHQFSDLPSIAEDLPPLPPPCDEHINQPATSPATISPQAPITNEPEATGETDQCRP